MSLETLEDQNLESLKVSFLNLLVYQNDETLKLEDRKKELKTIQNDKRYSEFGGHPENEYFSKIFLHHLLKYLDEQ